MSKFCTNCGRELKDTAKFCASCGSQIGPPHPQSAPPVQAQPHGPISSSQVIRKKRRFPVIRLMAILLIVAISVYFAKDYFFTNPYISSEEEASLNMAEIIAASPFYYYDNDLTGSKADKIESYIKDRADDSLEAAEKLFELHNEASTGIQELFDLTQVIRHEQVMSTDLYQMMLTYESLMTMSQVAKADYQSQPAKGSNHSYVNAQMTSQKLYYMVASTSYLSQGFEYLVAYSAMMVEGIGLGSPDASSNDRRKLNAAFESSSLMDQLYEMQAYVKVIEDNIRLVNIGKLEVASENIDQAWTQTPDLIDQLNDLDSLNHPLLTDQMTQDIHVLADAAAYNLILAKSYVDLQLEEIGSTSTMSLTSVDDTISIFPKAYAAENTVLDQKVDVTETIKEAPKAEADWWSQIKSYGQSFTDGVQTVAGTLVEGANVAVGSLVQVGVMTYDGVINGHPISSNEIINTVSDICEESGHKIFQGQAGSAIFNEGLDLIDKSSQAIKDTSAYIGQEYAKTTVDAYCQITGKNPSKVSKEEASSIGSGLGSFVGGIASATMMDMSKGLYKSLDPGASEETFTSGLLDITKGLIRAYVNIGESFGSQLAYRVSLVNLTTAVQDIYENNPKSTVNQYFQQIKDFAEGLIKEPDNSVTTSESIMAFEKDVEEFTRDNLNNTEIKGIDPSDQAIVKEILSATINNNENGGNPDAPLYQTIRDNVLQAYVPTDGQVLADVGSEGSQEPAIDTPDTDLPDEANATPDPILPTNPEDSTTQDSTANDQESSNQDSTAGNQESSDQSIIQPIEEVPTMNGDYVDLVTFLKNYFTLLAQLNGVTVEDLLYGQNFDDMATDRETSLEIGATTKESLLTAYILYAYGMDPVNYKNRVYEDVLESYFGPLPSAAFTDPEEYVKTLDQSMFGN